MHVCMYIPHHALAVWSVSDAPRACCDFRAFRSWGFVFPFCLCLVFFPLLCWRRRRWQKYLWQKYLCRTPLCLAVCAAVCACIH